MFMALTEQFTDTHPLKLSSNPLPLTNKMVNRQIEGNKKAVRCPVKGQEERKQKVTDAGCNKFLRINEQAESVEVRKDREQEQKEALKVLMLTQVSASIVYSKTSLVFRATWCLHLPLYCV